MKRFAALNSMLIVLLTVLTAAALLLNLPDAGHIAVYAAPAAIFGLLTTFTLYYNVLLTEGELSAAHVMGMVAFLSYPAEAAPTLLWGIFSGGLVGGLLLVMRQQEAFLRRRLTMHSARSVMVVAAQVTLSFYAAGQVYRLVNGELPLLPPLSDDLPMLVVYGAVYLAVYTAIFAVETLTEGDSIWRIVRGSSLEVLALLLLPVPFAIFSAMLIVVSPSSLPLFIGGAGLLVLGVYGFSRAQHRLREQVAELRAVAAVSAAIQADLNLDSLLNTIYQQVAALFNIRYFYVALYDSHTRQVRFPLAIRDGAPFEQPPRQVEASGGRLVEHVLRTQQPLLISRGVQAQASSWGLIPPGEPVHSWMSVPLLAGGRLLGAMVVTTGDAAHTLKPDDLRLLNTVAASVSVALDNAQLYRQQMERVEQLVTLNRVMALLTGTLSDEDILDSILSSASLLVEEAAAFAIYLQTDAELQLTRAAGIGKSFRAEPPPLLSDQQPQPIYIEDVSSDPRAAVYRDRLLRDGKAAWLELPLFVGETYLGVLAVFFDRPQRFNEITVEILRAFAGQAAQAINNARQYTRTDRALERRAEQMFALAALGRQLTATMNPTAICDLALQRALASSQATAGLIALKDQDSGDTAVLARAGYPAEMAFPAALSGTISERVLVSGLSARLSDMERVSGSLLTAARSHVSVPILRHTETVGVISLESPRADAFDSEDEHFLTQLASQMIIAMDNTRLFTGIAETRDRLQVIVNAMTEGIVLIDQSGTVTLANPRVDLIGFEPARLLNEKVEALLADPALLLAVRMGFENEAEMRALLDDLRTPGGWRGCPARLYTVAGEQGLIYIHRQVIPVGGTPDTPIGMLLVFYDQTEERELQQMRDDLSRMIVHDLRSPLTAVTTGLKLMRDVIPDNTAYRKVIESTAETSQRAIRKLMSRVDSLLDVSKMESGDLSLEVEPTELATLADSVCSELSPLAHELGVIVTSEVTAALPLLNVDGDKIERVLQNLVDNALKFTPSGGLVTIRAQQVNGSAYSESPAGFVQVEVADTGPGVPDEYKQRLFDRFVQVKGRRGARRGIGLGLTFCKLVVEAHGGQIWIEDNPGGGSLFRFTLPLTTAARFDETGEFPAISQTPG